MTLGTTLSAASDWLASPAGALGTVILLTMVVYVETTRAPWAPFFIAFGILGFTAPFMADRVMPLNPEAITHQYEPILLAIAALAVWEQALCAWAYEGLVLGRLGLRDQPRYSPTAALERLSGKVASERKLSRRKVDGMFALYVLAWAPVGENLLYWGYLSGSLQPWLGGTGCLVATALFFSIRHGIHFLFLKDPTPWPSLAAFSLSAFGSALIMGWLAGSTHSLGALILVQSVGNLIWLAQIRLHTGAL